MRIVDLFAGCGALTLGAVEAFAACGVAARVVLAVDTDPQAISVYRANFPNARVIQDRVENLLDGAIGAPLTPRERALQRAVGHVNVLLAGPPCQGYSDLNNHTRRKDERNRLYARTARALEVLKPEFALIENVPAVLHDAHGVVTFTRSTARLLGYTDADAVLDLARFGVPQRRRRHVLLLVSPDSGLQAESLADELRRHAAGDPNTVEWAIADLSRRTARDGIFDTPTTVSPTNVERIRWLFENEAYDLPNELRPSCHRANHSYLSMYGRLRPTAPAQTITTGFGSMGQGRYVHPTEPRMITAHEAARLQGIPDYFSFAPATNRTALRKLIGNAAPPALAEATLSIALRQLIPPRVHGR